MQVKSAEFIKSAVKPDQYPPAGPPEIAFAGRSNVGKSSLINTLLNRKHLVKTSSTPGRTQLLNFFDINGDTVFVDLPGYGYAKVPARIKKNWGPMVEKFLATRKTLKGVVLILDIRRTPQDEERDFIDWLLDNRIPVILVLTKADKLAKNKRIKQMQAIARELDITTDDLICFSAKTRMGLSDVWAAIDHLLAEGAMPSDPGP
ncbi:MAG TPA: ribosome biogenesis GTP-binding protein YihA/YsxC [Desulfosalsimonadaceae bacterium]|nr:ribosome biogenesis GTP-binding protein YihA/YsxC [Desulfosalsimonadaceae bacterium]